MTKVLQLGLGVVTAIGGFVDIGNLVTSGITGARFGASLTWAIVVGTIGMTVYAEMAGRDLDRSRLLRIPCDFP